MGGVAGHLSHMHETMDLTFGEIKSILQDVATARLDVLEKVDGQNIFFGWDAKGIPTEASLKAYGLDYLIADINAAKKKYNL